jgi:hypothetical protein
MEKFILQKHFKKTKIAFKKIITFSKAQTLKILLNLFPILSFKNYIFEINENNWVDIFH